MAIKRTTTKIVLKLSLAAAKKSELPKKIGISSKTETFSSQNMVYVTQNFGKFYPNFVKNWWQSSHNIQTQI